ncbi:hypothetical protein [Bartonella apihabitans]|uniref:hypothetical protein n=1 Tax=Bartonella apihabitans TaxID=2750929 RepID=UPI001CECD327|nr:hypothetical protein [Bartonella apihabitans]
MFVICIIGVPPILVIFVVDRAEGLAGRMLDVVSFEVLDGDWKYCSESDIQPLITTLQLIKKWFLYATRQLDPVRGFKAIMW